MDAPSSNSGMLTNIATDLTVKQVIEDKMKASATGPGEKAESSDKAEHFVAPQEMEEDEDELELEDDPEYRKYKEKRLAELKSAHEKMVENKAKGFGDYREIDQTDFLPTVTKANRVVCHFYHQDFERCKIVDEHLKKICLTHTEAKFIKIDAEKAPFFITKLLIKVLPTIVLFIDGVAVDRIVGFDDLGQRDDFPTLKLIRRLVFSKVLKALKKNESPEFHLVKKKGKESDEDDN
jgi:thiol-disulfide isomerase/thioredoxin